MQSTNIPGRIKLARKMAGLPTQASLLACIPGWKPSRLGNYEAGISTPSADDMLLIAEATSVSACWLMFGQGPIRPSERDLQAVRHQNLTQMLKGIEEDGERLATTIKRLRISRKRLREHLDNPFLPISDELAGRLERLLETKPGWLDEQHVEHDPLFLSFPEEMRELMMIYSELPAAQRPVLMATVRALRESLSATD
ncbi:helix-turn-helix domain-containing protein [Thiorhodococcus mannitoliphagus]|uniref:Helix-turn-helix domain-containing protein n=1 Tax=Thiorhodococcus mannitoliphagus TaxID=329406 RepID=A0A6P1E628_9GAMM|nr:helix-turn-helix transcriptional regulator [Thiorhodococcus mannitoliphagus]NEX23474.1 helix-turn-helix domain-containing protein [Thiorhodococcus mannitoliphagus]